jgi:transcriptional regulator with XRE-family HTH domain
MATNPITAKFAENLLILRRRAGLSQEELGFRANLHRTEIGQLELGYRDPKISTLVRLSGSLGVTPNDLLSGIRWKAAPQNAWKGEIKIRY